MTSSARNVNARTRARAPCCLRSVRLRNQATVVSCRRARDARAPPPSRQGNGSPVICRSTSDALCPASTTRRRDAGAPKHALVFHAHDAPHASTIATARISMISRCKLTRFNRSCEFYVRPTQGVHGTRGVMSSRLWRKWTIELLCARVRVCCSPKCTCRQSHRA